MGKQGESMKKASLSLVVILFASLISLEAFAQRENRPRPRPEPVPAPLPHYEERLPQEEVLSERIQQTVGRGQRLRLSQLLRSYDQSAEVISLSITAQSFSGPAQLQLLSGYQTIENLQVRRQLQEIPVRAALIGSLDMLELTSLDDIHIESITARVRSRRPQGPRPLPEMQVSPNTLITVRFNQDVVGGEVPLKRLVKEQLGLSLEGAQVERIAVEGIPIGRAASSIHVELNNRIASPVKYLSSTQRRLPLQVQSLEEVRSLRLVVSGPARIMDINIRIGSVRPAYNPIPVPLPLSVRLHVAREISPSYPLDLSQLSRELSPVRSLSIETTLRGYGSGEITLMSRMGHIVGRAFITQGRTLVLLTTPTALADIRIFTQTQVQVGMIEAELDRPIRY